MVHSRVHISNFMIAIKRYIYRFIKQQLKKIQTKKVIFVIIKTFNAY